MSSLPPSLFTVTSCTRRGASESAGGACWESDSLHPMYIVSFVSRCDWTWVQTRRSLHRVSMPSLKPAHLDGDE